MASVRLPTTLRLTGREHQLRSDIRSWLNENDVTVGTTNFDERIRDLAAWQSKLHTAGFMGLSWSEAYGGKGMSVAAEAVLAEELARSGTPELVNRLALYTLGPTIMQWGDAEQQSRFLPGMLDASEIWCQGFSEPGAGSDLAAIATTGRLDGNSVIVNGQKVWTSRALWSRWGLVLVRTDLESSRHRGLSMLIVDMTSPGITVRPLLQILHEPHFSEVFLDDVAVPIENTLGPIGEGWRVAMSTMGYERGIFALERQIRLSKRLDDLVLTLASQGIAHDHAHEIGQIAALLEALRAQVYRTLASQSDGGLQPGQTSVDKLLLTEADQRLFALAFDILGPELTRTGGDWIHDLLESRATSIYSGTTEIQLNVIASRLLGLPRSD